MSKKNLLSNIAVYSVAHALVDAACAATLFAILASSRNGTQNLVQLVLIYDIIAFSTQPVFGLLVDALKSPAQTAAVGIVLVAASILMMKVPLLSVMTAGIGNAVFHVGGGFVSINLTPGKATFPGIYVAPGALGLTIGIMIGRSGGFISWPFILLLLVSAALILGLPRQEVPAPRTLPGNLRWFEMVIILLLVSVVIRSLVGQSLVLPWKSDSALLLMLTMAVVLGKVLGGILADRFGWAVVALSGLILSAPLLAFFAPHPALAIAGTLLFNLSMPVTLVCLADMLPGKSGFAFGLTALALIVGALPTFTPFHSLTGGNDFIFSAIIISISALYGGLYLYKNYFRERGPALRKKTQSEEKKRRKVWEQDSFD
jgi:FSR family fosmidomycin resistance protein-like MFS transporter